MSLINQFVTTDHQRLNYLFDSFKKSTVNKELFHHEFFEMFKTQLLAHLDWEEQKLYPIILSLVPSCAQSIAVMCRQHQRLRELIGIITQKLDISENANSDIDRLEYILTTHNRQEEQHLYPLIDQYLSLEKQPKSLLSLI